MPVDPDGIHGPTPSQARRSGWRRTSRGLFVPADTDSGVVEQRIVEAQARGGPRAVVTGWAALRLHRGGFFGGLDSDGRSTLAVPMVWPGATDVGGQIAPIRHRVLPSEIARIVGVPCTSPERAVVDEVLRIRDVREGVRVIDMACAGELTSLRRLENYVTAHRARYRIGDVVDALDLAVEGSRSPPETAMRLILILDAGRPTPLCNHPVWSLDGDLLGVPDLFDDDAGVYGEYDGAHHRSRDRHRADVERMERFARCGVERFTMVAGDSRDVVRRRINAAYERAAIRQERHWSIVPSEGSPIPFGWEVSLNARLEGRSRFTR